MCHGKELALLVGQQLLWRGVLHRLASIHNQYSKKSISFDRRESASLVVVHNSVESMGDGYHRRRAELLLDCGLDERVCMLIHRSGGLVQHQDLRLPQESSSQADELSLSHTEMNSSKKMAILLT